MRFKYPLLFLSALLLASCGDSPTPPTPQYNYADVFIYMGQSNMAGRGEAIDSLPCTNNGFEYLSVTGHDDDFLVDLKEPFGKYENNEAMSDGNTGDGKKTGGVVSSFVEGYYSVSNIPIIGVSASVGNTSITQWQSGSTYLNESKRRLRSCIDYLKNNPFFVVRHINMVWCQGESDAGSYASGFDYFSKLQGIVNELKSLGDGYAIEKCFIIPLSIYSSSGVNPNKLQLANDQIAYCNSHPNDFALATKKNYNVPSVMRDDPHFHQGIYNVVGYDAGIHAAQIIEGLDVSSYGEFVPGEEITLAAQYGITLQYHT